MSQAFADKKDAAFDGRIQLNGDAAPELEVIVQLDDQHIVLEHSSGELGRWERHSVRVTPIGRGWFSLDVEDETVTFLPRRPGHFAASTVDLLPVEETKKKRFGRKSPESKVAETPPLSRRERKRRSREEEARASLSSPVVETTAPAPEPDPVPLPVEPESRPVEPPPTPAAPVSQWVEPAPLPAPEIRPPSSPTPPPSLEPASPWDDLPTPEVPGPKPRDKKRPRGASDALPKAALEKRAKSTREKPSKTPRSARQKVVEPAGPAPVVVPAGPPKKNVLVRLFTGFRHGVKGIALKISEELRQTGIVPFDRLPAAPGRKRPPENHEHVFQELRLPGGLTRNVCSSCGLVSIGESSKDD